MAEKTFYSWNVNGIRAGIKKGFFDWFDSVEPDFLALQETKIQGHQLTLEMTQRPGYHSYWSHAEKAGYSGTVIYTKHKPDNVLYGFGDEPEFGGGRFDTEGRTVMLEYPDYVFYGIYFPNGQRGDDRLEYKMAFYDAFLNHAEAQRKKRKHVIVCGDVNTAHKPIDLARPKANEKVSGFLPVERAWIDKLIEHGYVDTFREINGDKPDEYSWWNMRARARDRNVGWRIDYFFINNELRPQLQDAAIHQDVMGSDHCPLSIKLNV